MGSGATAWLTVRGLGSHLASRWLARYKNELDKEFEKYRDALEQRRKRVEADLGQRSYVSKAQFDTEFGGLASTVSGHSWIGYLPMKMQN